MTLTISNFQPTELYTIDGKLYYRTGVSLVEVQTTGPPPNPPDTHTELEWINVSEHVEWKLRGATTQVPDIGDGAIVANWQTLFGTAFFNLRLTWGSLTWISEDATSMQWVFDLSAYMRPNQYAYEAGIRHIIPVTYYAPGSSGGRFPGEAVWNMTGTDPKAMGLHLYYHKYEAGRIKSGTVDAFHPFKWHEDCHLELSTGPWELNLRV